MNRSIRHLGVWSAAICIAMAASFYPLLAGGFLFDDFANLKAIGEYGPIRDLDGLARYLTSGIADPLGRPLAMASFLLDARDWPAEPGPFLRSNLLLHVLNGLLLILVLARLARTMGLSKAIGDSAALAGAALWALHPLWVSTVGYVVQRHAMLAATFILLGLLAWLIALAAFRQGHVGRGWLWAGLAMPVCGVLAALSKANGMLLPLLVLAVHYFMLARPEDRQAPQRHAVRLLLVFPSLLLALGLLAAIDPDPPGRPWSLAERVMSQPRALVDYIFHLAIPRVDSVGLFADGFAVSRSLLSPWTALPATLFVLALMVAPFALRRSHPALAGALAFFLAGHAMESTVLPLELYFEHRNYLPAMLLGWPLALHLLSHPWHERTGPPILGVALAVLALLTFQRAQLWADAPRQAAVRATTLPDSPRAQTWAAQHEIERGDIQAAETRLASALKNHPSNVMLALNHLDISCMQGRLSQGTVRRAATALAEAGAGQDVVQSWLRGKLQRSSQFCNDLDFPTISLLVSASAKGSEGSAMATSRQRRLEGMLALSGQDCDQASRLFQAAQDAQRWASEAFGDAALLASACGPDEALAYLEPFLASSQPDATERPGMLRIHQWVLHRQGLWRDELVRLRTLLRAELAEQQPGNVTATEQD